MKTTKVLLCLLLFLNLTYAIANPLKSFQWKQRLVIVASSDCNNPVYVKQLQQFKKNQPAFLERHITSIMICGNKLQTFPDHYKISVEKLKKKYNLSNKTFKVILIGKDGGVKFSSDRLVSAKTISNQIDGMPMRIREMQKSNK